MRVLVQVLIWPFCTVKDALIWLFKTYALKTETGAEFATPRNYRKYLNASNTGLLLDGVDKALSERDSFQNSCVIARVGA